MAKAHEFKILESNIKVKVATNETDDVLGVTEPMTIDVQSHSCRLELYVINHEDHDVLRCLNWFAYFCPNEVRLQVYHFAFEPQKRNGILGVGGNFFWRISGDYRWRG